MTARSISMSAPFTWFMKALDVGRRNPKALFGAFALMLAVGLVPTVIQMVGEQLGDATSIPYLAVVYGLSMVISLLVMPPLVGAGLQLVERSEHGRPFSATDIFDGYRDRAFAVRMIQTSMLLVLIFIVVFALLYLVMPGKPFFSELFTRTAGLPPGAQPDLTGLPPFPPAFLLWFLVAFAAVMVASYVHMLAMPLAALGGHGPVSAVANAFAAVLRNALPFIGFTLVAIAIGFVAVLLLGLIAGVVIGLLSVLSPAIAMLVAIPLYLGVMLLVYVISFGFNYHAWREIFDGEAPTESPAALEA